MPHVTPPTAGRESVWDYPRPPRVERTDRHIRVEFNGETIADSHRALRVLETSHPPTYYLPPEDVRIDLMTPTPHRSFCEFKGQAAYLSIEVNGQRAEDVAWRHRAPAAGYEALRDYIAFYPSRVDACYVEGEPVKSQEGDFYGGWITDEIVGPFKGGPGTRGW